MAIRRPHLLKPLLAVALLVVALLAVTAVIAVLALVAVAVLALLSRALLRERVPVGVDAARHNASLLSTPLYWRELRIRFMRLKD